MSSHAETLAIALPRLRFGTAPRSDFASISLALHQDRPPVVLPLDPLPLHASSSTGGCTARANYQPGVYDSHAKMSRPALSRRQTIGELRLLPWGRAGVRVNPIPRREKPSRDACPYAEGVAHRSPRLPHLFAATLGGIARAVSNPEGVACRRRLSCARTRVVRNPSGVEEESVTLPRVAATRRP